VYPEKEEGIIINLITETFYESLQIRKKEQAAKNKYIRYFEIFDVSEGYLEQKRIEWICKTNMTLNYDDLIWSISNGLLLEYGKKNLYKEMSMLYFSMALFQRNHGKEFTYLLYEARKMELYDINANTPSEFKYKVVIIADLCPECLKLDSQKFTIKEALEQMPIPHKNCTYDGGWCHRCYVVELDDL
jgi:hypothetical protein